MKSDWSSIIEELDAISRTRALTDAESMRLQRAIENHDKGFPGNKPRWTAQDDQRLRTAIAFGMSTKQAAAYVGRSPIAVRIRMSHMPQPPKAAEDSCRQRGVIL